MKFDVMTDRGDRFYATVNVQVQTYPIIVDGVCRSAFDYDDAIKAVLDKLPTLKCRKNIRIFRVR